MSFILGLLSGLMIGALVMMWVAKAICEMTFESFMEKAQSKLDRWARDV